MPIQRCLPSQFYRISSNYSKNDSQLPTQSRHPLLTAPVDYNQGRGRGLEKLVAPTLPDRKTAGKTVAVEKSLYFNVWEIPAKTDS